jgi:hypothetical protein
VAIAFDYLRVSSHFFSSKKARAWLNGKVPAFQAGHAGSIPVARYLPFSSNRRLGRVFYAFRRDKRYSF